METLQRAVALGLILFMGALLIVTNQQGWIANINGSIALATAVLGFALSVFAAVKTGFAVTGLYNATREDILPSGGAAVAGAALLIASRLLAV